MTHRRMWWLLSPGLAGELGPVYHRIDRAKRRTACGIDLPEVYGLFFSLGDNAKRCAACVMALKTRRLP